MARRARFNEINIPMHIIQRGNNKQVCFFNDIDYKIYLDKLREYAELYQVDVHAFVLMTNHVHLLLTQHSKSTISKLMQSVGRYYVRYINQTYNRTGTLWEGRFKSTIIDSENYFLIVSKYIELNPVRAKMVKDPALYPWSSYQENALNKIINLITPHPVYLNLGSTPAKRKLNYRKLFLQEIGKTLIQDIRENTNKSWVLGSDKFIKQIEEQLKIQAKPKPRGGNQKQKKPDS